MLWVVCPCIYLTCLLSSTKINTCRDKSGRIVARSGLFLPFSIFCFCWFFFFFLFLFFIFHSFSLSVPLEKERFRETPLHHFSLLHLLLQGFCLSYNANFSSFCQVRACFYSRQSRFERATRSLATFVHSHRSLRSLAPQRYAHFAHSLVEQLKFLNMCSR